MLDTILAALYDVPTKRLNQAVRRNRSRFPEDFMFQLSWDEAKALTSRHASSSTSPSRSQSVTLKGGKNIKYRPYVFTEQGVAMLSSVLNSPRAIAVNIEIMRAFVKLREALVANKELAKKLGELETRIDRRLDTHDEAIAEIFHAIRQLMAPTPPHKKRRIGFV